MSENEPEVAVTLDATAIDALERIHEALTRIGDLLEQPTVTPRPGPCHQAAPPGVGIERGHRCSGDWGHAGAHVAKGQIETVTWLTAAEREAQEATR